MTSYPIDSVLPKLKETFRSHSACILHAPPGAGKTTRVPFALLDSIPPEAGRIVMLEPRRIAAVSAARWMAKQLNEEVGETIGYAIRFDTKRSERTRIEVVTEGILTRRLQSDPGLEGTAMVIFDEFHERSIHADLALALCLDVRKGLRPDLKILVMSATLDTGPIASLLDPAPVIVSAGKAFPVEERYLEDTGGRLSQRIVGAIRIALRETSGDILVFLPGSGEIRSCVRELNELLNSGDERIALHALYGDLPFEEQERAILPSKDRRKIVLATNIAETSLTIEGVHVVIDSGLTRMLKYDPATGMNRLVTAPVSRASAEQRKGRAGRLGPGVCYRLYAKHELHGMLAFTQPEILVSDLSPLALELAVWGVNDPAALSWLDPPPSASWTTGVLLLKHLNAVDASGFATTQGRSMARLPLHPRLSRLMVRAEELGCTRLGADLAALLTERDIFRHRAEDRIIHEPDISERVDALRRGRSGIDPAPWNPPALAGGGKRSPANSASSQAREVALFTGATGSLRWGSTSERVDPSAFRAVERTAKQLLRLMPGAVKPAARDDQDNGMIARLLLVAYPDRICKRREEGGGRFVHMQGRGVRLSLDSHLGSSPYIIAVMVDAGEKTEGIVHIAAPVTSELIRSECRDRITIIRRVEWDKKENRIAAALEERLDTLLLSTRPFTPSDEEAAPLLCEAIRSDPGMLTFSKEARQFQNRTGLMQRAFPEEVWPDVSDESLCSRPEDWLLPWLVNIRSAQGLSSLNILPALKAHLNWEQGRMLDERAPATIMVPSGSRVTLDYASGEQPVLAVKLQEMFGLADTPLIAGGRVRVLLHLLSPARRPVQITQDLKGFWNTGYQLVKKDLKGRYPRHPWPDDPWNAVPTRRAKPRG